MFGRVAASPSQSFLAVLVAFIVGISAHSLAERPWQAFAFAACSSVALVAAALARGHGPRFAAFLLAAACAGVARYDVALSPLPAPAALGGVERDFTGTLASEPRHGIDGTVLLMDRVFVSTGGASPVGARMEVRTKLPVDAAPGDRFRWSCRPSPLEGERSDAAVFLRGIGWRCRSRSVPERVGTTGNGVMRFAVATKGMLRAAIGRLVPEPSASLLLGLLVGDRDGLPRDVADAFRRTGTAHVLAVSGYNVSRLAGAFVILFAVGGIARRRASAGISAAVILFAAFVGAEASVVRAAVMGCAGILATSLGRRYHGTNAFMLAAASMLAFQPLLLRHDAGFRLSFAAVAGLHAFGPPLSRRLRFLPDFAGIRSSFAETIGATLMTVPLVLRDFGILPVFGVLTNVAVAPLVPLAMAAGFVTLALSALTPFALAPAFAATALLRLLVAIVTASARTFPVVEARTGTPTMAILYAWIFLLWFALRRIDALCEEEG